MAYEAEIADLSYLKAERLSGSGNSLTKDSECVLSWKLLETIGGRPFWTT